MTVSRYTNRYQGNAAHHPALRTMLSLVYADTDPVLAYLFQGDDMGLFAVSFASPCMNPCQRELLRNQSSGAFERSATASGATDRLADTESSQLSLPQPISWTTRKHGECQHVGTIG